jgi:hypothetical protein
MGSVKELEGGHSGTCIAVACDSDFTESKPVTVGQIQ